MGDHCCTPATLSPGRKSGTQMYRRLGGPQIHSGWVVVLRHNFIYLVSLVMAYRVRYFTQLGPLTGPRSVVGIATDYRLDGPGSSPVGT